ncbi:integral membrane protein [alpha proteobacterium U9-1i]|nr:integral membrane protein [alpha proteobacterium U9-1i]
MVMALWLWLGVINLFAFVLFWWDKRASEANRSRVPEKELLGLALVGGALGALLGQQLFRHKTRKEPFRTYLRLAAVLNILVVGLIVSPEGRTWVIRLFTAGGS